MIHEILYKLFGIEERPCDSCETLKQQLALANQDRERLLELIIKKNEPEVEVSINKEPPKPIGNQYMLWRVRQQQLEKEDRALAARLKKENEELEAQINAAGTEKESKSL